MTHSARFSIGVPVYNKADAAAALVAYGESGVPAAVLRPLLTATDRGRFNWRQFMDYCFLPPATLFVRLNMLRQRTVEAARSLFRLLVGGLSFRSAQRIVPADDFR